MQQVSRTQPSGVGRGPINQSSTLRKARGKTETDFLNVTQRISLHLVPSLPHGLALLLLFSGRPEIPPLETSLWSVSPVAPPRLCKLRQRLSGTPQALPGDTRGWRSAGSLPRHPRDTPSSWSSLLQDSGTVRSDPIQMLIHCSPWLNLRILTDPNDECQELWEPRGNTDHGPWPALSARNVQPDVQYSQNRRCFQNSDATRLIGKYVFQEKIYVSNCNA